MGDYVFVEVPDDPWEEPVVISRVADPGCVEAEEELARLRARVEELERVLGNLLKALDLGDISYAIFHEIGKSALDKARAALGGT